MLWNFVETDPKRNIFNIIRIIYFLGPLGLKGILYNTIYRCTFWVLWITKEYIYNIEYIFWVAQKEDYIYIF